MGQRSIIRRVLLWTGAVTCVLLVGLYFVSLRYSLVWRLSGYYGSLAVIDGHVLFAGGVGVLPIRGVLVYPTDWFPPGGHICPRADAPTVSPTPRSERIWWPWIGWRTIGRATLIGAVAPIWALLLLVAAPTAGLWWLGRRRIPPGHCQKCGYNLTGNVSGRCPECGTATDANSEHPAAAARSEPRA